MLNLAEKQEAIRLPQSRISAFQQCIEYDPENWKIYLKPLKRLESDSLVFYVFDPDLTNLDQNQIISFKDYRLKAGK